MEISDLKDGMIVETGEDLYLVCGDKFLSLNGYMEFKDYDENLKIKDEEFEKYNINFVYKEAGSLGLGLKNLLNSTNLLEKIWERPREIDWTKVPRWIKVQVKDYHEEPWRNAYFIRLDDSNGDYPYKITFCDTFTLVENCICGYMQCRIHPEQEIKEEWYK